VLLLVRQLLRLSGLLLLLQRLLLLACLGSCLLLQTRVHTHWQQHASGTHSWPAGCVQPAQQQKPT
jgi:hypothetical protein